MAKVVLGEGNIRARVMLVGEALGAEEEKLGRPFVGKAGKLLDKQLKTLKIDRKELYITNLVKVRPPNNRKPNKKEVVEWAPTLIEEIDKIRPNLIVTLGASSSQFILDTKDKMEDLVGNIFALDVEEDDLLIYVLPVYHPSFVGRFPELEKEWLQDLKIMKEYL